MTVTECVQSVLESDAPLAAIFPEGQIFAPWPRQSVDRPYIVHMPVSIEPVNIMQGAPPKVQWGYQVSIFSSTMEQGEEAALLVIAALVGNHTIGSPITDRISAIFTGGSFYLGRSDEEDVEHFAVQFMISKSL